MTTNGFFPEDLATNTIIHWPLLPDNDIVYRLRKRAEIRRQIPSRKSVQENKPDRIADLLEEAASYIELLEKHSEIMSRV